jgi:hypothetical protein
MRGVAVPRFVLGVDVGQLTDHTAAVALEIVPTATGEHEVDYGASSYTTDPRTGRRTGPLKAKTVAHLHARHVERLPLGQPYPQQVAHVAALLARPPLAGQTQLVLDATGVGRAIVDLHRAAGLQPVAITITAGAAVHREGWDDIHVPKKDLIGVVQVLLQQQRLKIAEGLPTAALLTTELLGFRQRITAHANITYGAGEDWRSAPHDDLVLATALAAWYAEQPRRGWGSV